MRERVIKERLTYDSFEEVEEKAELYHKIRKRIGLNHQQLKAFLKERKNYTLKEIASALKIDDDC